MAVENAKEIFEKHIPGLIESKPDLADKVKASYKFAVGGDQGGTWLVDLSAAPGSVTEGDGDAMCTITIKDTDLVDIVNGKLNSQMAFMSGKLKVAGDMSLALKLNALF